MGLCLHIKVCYCLSSLEIRECNTYCTIYLFISRLIFYHSPFTSTSNRSNRLGNSEWILSISCSTIITRKTFAMNLISRFFDLEKTKFSRIKCISQYLAINFNAITLVNIPREKGRDLTQSYDKSPYTNRKVKRAR